MAFLPSRREMICGDSRVPRHLEDPRREGDVREQDLALVGVRMASSVATTMS